MIRRYLTIALAAVSLLVGVQIPGFVTQYELRLAGHLAEANESLKGWQSIADRYHGGSLAALIKEHERSDNPVFRSEAEPIAAMVARRDAYAAEAAALAGAALPAQCLTILRHGSLLDETVADYRFIVTLDRDALIAGAVVMLVGLAATDGLLGLLLLSLRLRRRRGQAH